MRDNVGIAELSSPMLRDLLREACAGIGRVAVYPSVQDARVALARNPPKVLIVGGAPLDPALLELLKRATTTLGVLGLAVADAHDLQLAMQAGALEGFPRSPEGLRQLALRMRPLLAPSLRPAPSASQRAFAAAHKHNSAAAPVVSVGPTADRPITATPSHECELIVVGSFAPRGDALGYLLSRLPNTLPGIVLVHGHIQPTSELTRLLTEECTWRIHEAGEPGVIQNGSVWIAQRSGSWRLKRSEAGLALERPGSAANSSEAGASTDTFFEAVARALGPRALGVLIGASGDEGNRGLRALRAAGSYTLAQLDPSQRVSDHPPHTSNRPAAAHELLGLDRLPQAITAYCQGHNSYRSRRPHGS